MIAAARAIVTIGEEEQEGTARDRRIERRQTKAHRCQRRHQRSGDRDADDRAGLAANHRIGARQRGKERDHQVEQIGPGARGDFTGHRLQRRQQDDEGGERDRHQRAARQRDDRPADFARIGHGEAKAQPDDRPHQRRDQHRADHHGRRGEQQAEHRNARRHQDHEGIGRGPAIIGPDPFEHGLMIDPADYMAAPPARNGAPQGRIGYGPVIFILHGWQA